jgi:acyl carrier protein
MELLVASATVLGVAILAVVVLRSESHQRNKKFEAVFSGREQLAIDQFYERYFKARGIPLHVVSGVRKILEEQLLADMSRLTDTDDFSKNLNFFFDFDSMVDVEIVCALEKEFGIEISDEEAINTKTINDMMQLVCRKLEVKDAA